MTNARFIVADVFDGLAKLEDDSVDLVFTSPPFLALRSYLPADHPDKGKEVGSEATPAAFIDTLLDVVEACDRVLSPQGTLCFELGDTYAGGDDPDWPLAKSLACIPALFETALAYGMNPLRSERMTPRWRVRNLVPWCRPNPPVGALGDKWRPATSYVTVACKARDRWFDLDAVRMEWKNPKQVGNTTPRNSGGNRADSGKPFYNDGNPNGAPPLDFLVLPTAPYPGTHYATMSPALVKPFVESMCPPGGTVLDPFAGSGTTLMVATGCGRNAVGIDIDERNADLARERCGMFFKVL